MAQILLHLRDIELTFGGKPMLEGAELALSDGERIALVGRNGSGKSTLLKIAGGLVDATRAASVAPARHHRPLSAAGAGFRRASPRCWTMSRQGLDRPMIRTAACTCCSDLGLTGDEDPATLVGRRNRAAPPLPALWRRARHPAA